MLLELLLPASRSAPITRGTRRGSLALIVVDLLKTLAACLSGVTLVLMAATGIAATPDMFSRLPGSERLANLEIEIWPEYDRQAALVFLKGEIAPKGNPSISLRIPASSGGPVAVAHSATVGGNLLNLPYERSDEIGRAHV